VGLSTLANILWRLYGEELPDAPMRMANFISNYLQQEGYEIVKIKKEGVPITGTPSVASQEPTSS
jgi:hypothetical protein